MISSNSTTPRYGSLSIFLHWLTAVLVGAAIVAIELKGWFPKGSELRESAKFWHFQLGALVLLISVARLAWSLCVRGPEPLAPRGSMAHRLGVAAHAALYVLLLVLPASGLVMLVVAGKPVSLLGFDLPVSVPGDRPLAKGIEEIHEFLGNAMMVLIGLHAAAALWHEYVWRDGTLRRMLPQRR